MRNPALADLMGLDTTHPTVTKMGGYATSIMLLGWGLGGILFGVMADKFGRAKMMIITVIFYAGFTGLCGLATCWWDFFLYRFFCGMGVGGFFAAGVTMLAETMPDKARPKTLGLLQVIAAACNVCACALAMICGILEAVGFFQQFPLWRCLFIVGFIPALLAFVIMRHLKEPEAWKKAIAEGGMKKAGSIPDLFRHPRWRYNVIIGMCLATCGVIGLWGIGFFSGDLTRIAFRNVKDQEARERGEIEQWDFALIRILANNPSEFLPLVQNKKLTPQSFIGSIPGTNDAGMIFQVIAEKRESLDGLNAETILAALDTPSQDGRRKAQTPEERERRRAILMLPAPAGAIGLDAIQLDANNRLGALEAGEVEEITETTTVQEKFDELADNISKRAAEISGHVTFWGSMSLLLFNLGAVIGTWIITLVAERWGRRIAFTLFFAASFFMTIVVFLTMDTPLEVFILQPILGFCILSIFGVYAIYFPELFPTRLRSTAISFCYNIARFAAATGPAGLGILTAYVFYGMDEPIRWAGAAMSVTFILGIIFAWMGPETKGQPLPEE